MANELAIDAVFSDTFCKILYHKVTIIEPIGIIVSFEIIHIDIGDGKGFFVIEACIDMAVYNSISGKTSERVCLDCPVDLNGDGGFQ